MRDRTSISKKIFFAALDADEGSRNELVRERCGEDEELRDEVEALLRAHGDTAEFLERPAYGPARERIGLSTGDEVGPYRLSRILGEGGMGVVWLAEQSSPIRREVALKVIKPGMDSQRVVARFEAERQTLALMSHDGIARVFDAGCTERGYPYFAMEYVEGVTITDFCVAHELDQRARIELFREVCEAVRHAHQKGVLHRDLKPSNLLVSEAAGRTSIKVIDFGVAKALGGGAGEALTQSGTIIGTAEYMSPEQADQAEGEIDTRSDLYSLGVVLFEVLTGALPIDVHTNEGITEVRRRIMQQPPRAASDLRRSLRGDLDQILAHCLEKRPAERYATVAELSADLTRHLNHEPILAGPSTRRAELVKSLRRHRGLVMTTAIVLFALTLGLVASIWQGARARRAETRLLSLSNQLWLERCVELAYSLPYGTLEEAQQLRELEGEFAILGAQLPELGERLIQLRASASSVVEGDLVFETRGERWEHELLARLVAGLSELESPDPALSARVAAGLRAESALRAAVLAESHAEEWALAIDAIASADRYASLSLSRQVGLIPLGPDPASGLWEFWHPQSGARPERGAAGEWNIGEDTGLVFILIPAGEFAMGAQRPGSGRGLPGVNIDSDARSDEGPVHSVSIGAAFLISKYELTQGQWRRLEFANPSQYQAGTDRRILHNEGHPVEQVSRGEAQLALLRLGLSLPTEAQWEYAARAGSSTPYSCGVPPACLEGRANLRDLSTLETNLGAMGGVPPEDWNDGYPTTAPVGQFEPNAFGLHDTAANVHEWVLDHFASYAQRGTDPRDGARLDTELAGGVLGRGGSFVSKAHECRVSARSSGPEGTRAGVIGFRPARPVR